ncbi:MAG: nitrite reductase small subunit NirD [Gammaproteobacteria bacterium]
MKTNLMRVIEYIEDTETWENVCRADQLIDNIGVCALIGDLQVAIFRLSGTHQLYAIDNRDPFSAASVLSRGVVGDLKGQPVVASPIYKQHFNLATGQCLDDAAVKLATYPVRIENGVVQVMLPAKTGTD